MSRLAVAGIVLAAGGASRMARPKLLLPAPDGRTLIGSASGAFLDAGLARVVVVLGWEASRMQAHLAPDPRLHVVVNDRWADGMASSLAAGLAACGDAGAALVTLGDLAGQTAERARAVVEAAGSGAPLVVPVTSSGKATHPVLFRRCLWEELRALSGDVGARDVVRRHLAEAARVPLPPLLDVDTEEDYRDLVEGRLPDPAEGLELP